MRTRQWIGTVAAIAAMAGQALAAPYVILTDGRRVEGQRIRALPDGTINLVTAQGTVSYQKGMYTKAVADKPAELGQAESAIAQKNYDAAVKTLEKVAKEYRYLDWDLQAQKMLAKALLAKGDGEGAAKAYAALFQMSPAEKQVSENAWGQRQALLLSKQYATLQRQLDAVAAEGPRSEAAKAQNMRGDIQLAQNNLEDAVMDYLRTAILYQDVADAEIQGEACFKAAQILEQMRDTGRAKDLYRKAATDWKGSSWAQKAQGKF